MAREHLRIVGQLGEQAQAVDDLEHGTALEVGPPDGALEKRVAREGHLLLLAEEGHGATGVAWGLYDFELVAAELDDLVVLEEMADGREVVVELELVEGVCLLLEVLHQALVGGRHLGLEPKVLVDGVVTKIVVQMSVRNQQVYWLELVLIDVVNDGLALFWIERATIYDDALLRFVADDVAILLEHIDLKSFDM